MTKRRLGRGLDALLSQEHGGHEPGSVDAAAMMTLAVDLIDPNPYQPRREFDETEMHALASSVKQHGVIQPILVRSVEAGRYQLIAGERRLRACLMAQVHQVPARILELDDRRVAELAMVENLQREDLGPLEKAIAFRDYLASYQCTQEELATRLGIDRSTVANLIRILELPEEVLDFLRSKQITQGHARALLGLEDPQERIAACRRVVEENLSVRQTESLVATGDPGVGKTRIRKDAAEIGAEGEQAATPAKGTRPPHFVELETQLQNQFGTPVFVKSKSKERGQIIIEFNNQEEFERVAALIRLF